jgi:hypothetical protein
VPLPPSLSGLVEGKIQMLFDAFKGTPTFNLAMRWSGWGVAPESIILGSLSQVGGQRSGQPQRPCGCS